jgi:hypothetical protein
MQQRHNEFREPPYFGTVRAKLGQAVREQHDLMEPLAAGLLELLGRLEIVADAREAARARLYGEIDEAVAAIVRAVLVTALRFARFTRFPVGCVSATTDAGPADAITKRGSFPRERLRRHAREHRQRREERTCGARGAVTKCAVP